PFDFARSEPMGSGQELEVGAVELGRHAVRTTEVTTVDDRDPQIAQRAAQAILDRSLVLPLGNRVRHICRYVRVLSQTRMPICLRYSNLDTKNEPNPGRARRGIGIGKEPLAPHTLGAEPGQDQGSCRATRG